MSIEAARKWIQAHSDTLPALSAGKSRITDIFNDSPQLIGTVHELFGNDLGLSLALLKHVNHKRGEQSGLDPIGSVQSALSMLGQQAIQDLVNNVEVAETLLDKDYQLLLYRELIGRSLHNRVQADNWAEKYGLHQREPIRLAAFFAYLGETLCCVHDFETYLKCFDEERSTQQIEKVFGFGFYELGAAANDHYHLPGTVTQSLPHQSEENTSRIVSFTTQICELAEHGWNNSALNMYWQGFSELLQQPLDRVISQSHQQAVLAAQEFSYLEVWHPASRLLLIDDQLWVPVSKPKQQPPAETQQNTPSADNESSQVDEPAKARPAAATPPPQKSATSSLQEVVENIKQLLKQPDTSQTQIITSCLHGLQDQVGMSRVSLMLLSKDKKVVHCRINLGFEPGCKIKNLQYKLAEAGLFKALIQKGQAIHINKHSFAKYQKLIPSNFLAQVSTNDFVAMPLFIEERPIGLVYADIKKSPENLTSSKFNQFKQLISLTTKALTILQKKQQSAKSA